MCYLKNLNIQEDQEFNIWNLKEQESSDVTNLETNVLIPCIQKHMGVFWNQQQQNLVKIFQLIHKNNRLISEMNKLISTNSQQVEKITINYENQTYISASGPKKASNNLVMERDDQQSNDTLLQKLFGPKKYNYLLQPTEKFEETIYKQRNFNIGVKLVDKNNKLVRNGNLLTLCFAICTSQAEWVNQSRIGEQFMKGKTQIQLYKGQALFQKLYAREVSRIYPGGKINVVIYAKPSTLKYSISGPNQQSINSEEIQPLIIQNISIRAKRKQ